MSSKEISNFVENFSELLADNGDMFFSSGNIKRDYEGIVATIKAQGYWAGNALRYFFDKDFNLTSTEERHFGN